jgi:hypothetical protein
MNTTKKALIIAAIVIIGLYFLGLGLHAAYGAEVQYIDPLKMPWLESHENVLGVLDQKLGTAETNGYYHFDCNDDMSFCTPYYLEGKSKVNAPLIAYFDSYERLYGYQVLYTPDMYTSLIDRIKEDFSSGGWITMGSKTIHVYTKEMGRLTIEVEVEYDTKSPEVVFISTIKSVKEMKREKENDRNSGYVFSHTHWFVSGSSCLGNINVNL